MATGASEPQHLTASAERERSPWSPNGTRITFVRQLPGRIEVRMISANGGAEPLIRTFDGDIAETGVDWQPGGEPLAVPAPEIVRGIRVSDPGSQLGATSRRS